MILNIPLAIWFGILTITSMFIAVTFALTHKIKQHKIAARITIALAIIHVVLAVMLWFYGINV